MKEVTILKKPTVVFNEVEVCLLLKISRRTFHRWQKEGLIPETVFETQKGLRVYSAKQVMILKRLMWNVRKMRKRDTDPLPREYILKYLQDRNFGQAI